MLLNLTELSAEPMHSQITRQLRAKILTGDLAEDSPLPPIRSFARENRVNALAVRRAFEDLESEGLVRRRGEGWMVAAVSAEQKREVARARLLESLRDQELSLKELELARDIQCRLLPPGRVAGRGFTVVSRNEPARFVAGDFYDVLRQDDGGVGVVVADVAGKGIAASLIMASVKAMMPFIAAERSVEETLGELNRRLHAELGRRQAGPRTFVALAYARFDPPTRRLSLANAGMPDPYRLLGDGSWEPVVVPGERLPLGMRAEVAYASRELELRCGERLLLVSDGVPEARRPDGEPVGYETLEGLLGGGPEPGEAWLDALLERVRELSVPELEDDWTAVLVESQEI